MIKESNWRITIKYALQNNKTAQLLEIGAVFLVAFLIIIIALPFTGDNPILRQSVVWIANIAMLFVVWLGLRLRGQNFQNIGLSIKYFNIKSVLLSLLVFLSAMIGFIFGSIVMANIVGIPEGADMSTYNYIQGNLLILIGALLAVFIVSSVGEEIIYRGFLITRISEMGGNSRSLIVIAIIVSSIIFAFVHFDWGWMGIGQTGFMGLALGISYQLSKRNLVVLILAHAYMDAILMIQMYLGVKF